MSRKKTEKKQRKEAIRKLTNAQCQPAHTEADIALSVSEDKRLVRMGIDPDGDPIEIMRQVQARLKYLEENPDAT